MTRNNDELLIGGFGQPAQNVDATGRMIQDNRPPVPRRKPETIAPTIKGNELLDFIGKLESGDNYNVMYGDEEKPLTRMTVKKVRELQSKLDREGTASTALGRYQIKDTTLDYLTKRMNLSGNETFDEKLQDQMARKLLEKEALRNIKPGR